MKKNLNKHNKPLTDKIICSHNDFKSCEKQANNPDFQCKSPAEEQRISDQDIENSVFSFVQNNQLLPATPWIVPVLTPEEFQKVLNQTNETNEIEQSNQKEQNYLSAPKSCHFNSSSEMSSCEHNSPGSNTNRAEVNRKVRRTIYLTEEEEDILIHFRRAILNHASEFPSLDDEGIIRCLIHALQKIKIPDTRIEDEFALTQYLYSKII